MKDTNLPTIESGENKTMKFIARFVEGEFDKRKELIDTLTNLESENYKNYKCYYERYFIKVPNLVLFLR